jgi:hypothetical protein
MEIGQMSDLIEKKNQRYRYQIDFDKAPERKLYYEYIAGANEKRFDNVDKFP